VHSMSEVPFWGRRCITRPEPLIQKMDVDWIRLRAGTVSNDGVGNNSDVAYRASRVAGPTYARVADGRIR
jgi:hypothetical protein